MSAGTWSSTVLNSSWPRAIDARPALTPPLLGRFAHASKSVTVCGFSGMIGGQVGGVSGVSTRVGGVVALLTAKRHGAAGAEAKASSLNTPLVAPAAARLPAPIRPGDVSET